MNARYYVPNTNRWLSPDTIVPDPTNPQSFNRYSYVRNNPVKLVDPSGHIESDCGGNTGDECGFVGNTWLGSWLGWDNVNPDAPDATGIGATVSVAFHTPLASAELNFGKEYVHDPDAGETTLFWVAGGDLSLGFEGGFIDFVKEMFSREGFKFGGAQVGVSPYVATYDNVNDVVSDVAGQFVYNTKTAAVGVGPTWGTANVPGDINQERAHSNVGGLFFGNALSINGGTNYYVPVYTTRRGRILPEINIFDYIMGLLE